MTLVKAVSMAVGNLVTKRMEDRITALLESESLPLDLRRLAKAGDIGALEIVCASATTTVLIEESMWAALLAGVSKEKYNETVARMFVAVTEAAAQQGRAWTTPSRPNEQED